MRMHDDEVHLDTELVARLVRTQFPDLAHLPVRAVGSVGTQPSIGTVNAVYRIGADLCARLPRVAHWAADLEREQRWLPILAPRLSLAVPEPVGAGRPDGSYPFPWAVYRWIDGRPYDDGLVPDAGGGGERRAAADLARFVAELRRIEPTGAEPPGGRRPLRELDAETRVTIDAGGDVVDRAAATAAWERALEAPVWTGTPVWVHADLLRPNLLVRDGRLVAVIDFGGAGVGDPAADVIAAWTVFGRPGRAVFRAALGVDDATWERARGYALHQALAIIPYYGVSNPAFAALALRTVRQLLADID